MVTWQGMPSHSISSTSNCIQQAHEWPGGISPPGVCPCLGTLLFIFLSLLGDLVLLQSKLQGYGEKFRCDEQKPRAYIRCCKNGKLIQCTTPSQLITFKVNILWGSIRHHALCLHEVYSYIIYEFILTCSLRNLHFNARLNHSYLFSIYRTYS